MKLFLAITFSAFSVTSCQCNPTSPETPTDAGTTPDSGFEIIMCSSAADCPIILGACNPYGYCVSESVCGNGILDSGEECDDWSYNADNYTCLVTCRFASCGDGFTCNHPNCEYLGMEEQCDDGNVNNSDGCNATCQTEGN